MTDPDVTQIQNQVQPPSPAIQPSTMDSTETQVQPNSQGPGQSQPQSQNQAPSAPNANPQAILNNRISQTPDQDILPPKVHGLAKVMRGISDVLAPQQYKTTINDDGTTTKIPIPRTKRDIGMSIAFAALTGAFKGLGERGPGATGRAALAGFDAVSQAKQQAEQQQTQEAQADFARKQSTLSFNLQLASAARAAGMQDKEDNDSVVAAFAPQVDEWSNLPNSGDVIKFGSKESPLSEDEAADIKKHSAFNLQRIPVNTVPRLDQGGNQVWIGLDGKIVPEGTKGAHRAWDHGYILVDPKSPVALSDENGAKDWVKEGVTKWGGIVPGLNPSLVIGDGAKGNLSAPVAGRMMLQIQQLDSTQKLLDTFTNTLDEDKKSSDKSFVKPIDLKNSLKTGLVTLKDLQNLQNAAGNSSQGNSTVLNTQIDAIRAKDPKSASRLQALFGGENLETYKQKILAQGAAIKAEEEKRVKGMEISDVKDAEHILALNKANPGTIPGNKINEAQSFINEDTEHHENLTFGEEQARNRVLQDEQNFQDARTAGPDNFRPDQNLTPGMNIDQLKGYLQKNKVTIPSDFEALYSVGKEYSDNLNKVFPTRVSKGTNQTDANHALTFIHKYLNPNFNDANFEAGKRFLININDPQRSPVIASGVASQHLDLLRTAGDNLKNGDLQALNHIANSIGAATGNSAPVVFKAIADQVNQEVGKVVAGGAAYEGEINKLAENLNKDQSPKQIDDVIRGYIRLMAGRLNELDFDSKRLFNKPLGVNPTVTDLFNRYHQSTQWESDSPRYQNGKLIGYSKDGKTMSRVVPVGQ